MDMLQFFTLENAVIILAAFVVGVIVEGIKKGYRKCFMKDIPEILFAFIPFLVAVIVFCAWSLYFDEGHVEWYKAPYLILAWGASSSYVYRWFIKNHERSSFGSGDEAGDGQASNEYPD